MHTSLYWCVRELRLFCGFERFWQDCFFHCVLACTSPVAVHAWSSTCARSETSRVSEGVTSTLAGLLLLTARGLLGLLEHLVYVLCQPQILS